MNIIESLKIDIADLKNTFMPHQIDWIQGEDSFHAAGRQVVALTEKLVLAIWSSHDGEDTSFNEFTQEFRTTMGQPAGFIECASILDCGSSVPLSGFDGVGGIIFKGLTNTLD